MTSLLVLRALGFCLVGGQEPYCVWVNRGICRLDGMG
jgi:hypothetical protein